MLYCKHIARLLIVLLFILHIPTYGNATESFPDLQLPPSPLARIHDMLNARQLAKEQIKSIQLQARTLIAETQAEMDSARNKTKIYDNQLINAWKSSKASLSDLNSASEQFQDQEKNSHLAMETMREIYRQSEIEIEKINRQVAQIEKDIEQIRSQWTGQYGAMVLDVARENEQRIQKTKAHSLGAVFTAREQVSNTKALLVSARKNLQQIQQKAQHETQQFATWVQKQQQVAKQAEAKNGNAWYQDSGSFSDMQRELEWSKIAKNRAELAVSQAKVMDGLIAAEIAVAQAKIESLEARLHAENNTLSALENSNNLEINQVSERQELLRALTTLVQGPLRYSN